MFRRLDDASVGFRVADGSARPFTGAPRPVIGHITYREGDSALTESTPSGQATGQLGAVITSEGPRRAGVPGRTPRRRHPSWATRYALRLALLDVIIGTAALVTAVLVAARGVWGPEVGVPWSVVALAVAWPITIAAYRGYDRNQLGVGQNEMGAVLRAGVTMIVLATFLDAFVSQRTPISLVVVAVPVAVLGGLVLRYASRKLLHHRQAQGHDLRRVLLVGAAASVGELDEQLATEVHHGMRVMGVCVPADQADAALAAGLPVVGDAEDAALIARNLECDAVAVTGGNGTGFLRRLAWSLEGSSVDLLVHPGLVEVAGPRMHIRQHIGLPLLHVEEPHFTGWRRMVKRSFDLVATSVGIALISPVLVGIAAAIKLGDGGPVFFRQERVGIDGSTFTMIKFRSMVIDAEARKLALAESNEGAGPLFKMKQDPRITRVGRLLRAYSLDELPQLFNVLMGHMSLVGPRPPLPSEAAEYSSAVRRRLLVTPGLTGLWQVSGRSLLSWEESVRLDLRYVENWSLTMDLLLLWKTVWAVLAKRGAF